jgi:hypothetical protein
VLKTRDWSCISQLNVGCRWICNCKPRVRVSGTVNVGEACCCVKGMSDVLFGARSRDLHITHS